MRQSTLRAPHALCRRGKAAVLDHGDEGAKMLQRDAAINVHDGGNK